MSKLKYFITALLLTLTATIQAQTLDTQALAKFAPTTVREVYEVAKYVKLTAKQQKALAKAFDAEAKRMVEAIAANDGVLSVTDQRELARQRDKTLAKILDDEQLHQYWRGVYDKEAQAEANAVVDKLRRDYGITDQNAKFVRVAFYKIGLDSRVNDKLLPPAKARKANEQLRREQLKTIEEKGGIRVNDDLTMDVLVPFDPNSLHKE